jgi:PAS domain S-box-containing protein
MDDPEGYETSLSEEGRFRILVEAITDYAIYMLDPKGVVSSWNPGAQRFKGYRAGEIIGQHFSRFYTEEDRRAGLPVLALETAAREGRFENEGWRVRKDGSRFWADVVIDRIQDPASGADAQAQRGAFPAARARGQRLRHLHARSGRSGEQLEPGGATHQGLQRR